MYLHIYINFIRNAIKETMQNNNNVMSFTYIYTLFINKIYIHCMNHAFIRINFKRLISEAHLYILIASFYACFEFHWNVRYFV